MTFGYVGYKPLQRGRIHLYCPACKRKMSNTLRQDAPPKDPARATLCHVLCERCSYGTKDAGMRFFDAKGRELCSFCGRRRCWKMGGARRCDEGLLREENPPASHEVSR